MKRKGLLDGLRVVELSTFVAAGSCGRMLAEWGADVIKVESPQGDPFRHFGPFFHVPATEEENPYFDIYNAEKRSVVLDLKKAEDMERFHQLLSRADVFLTNNRSKALVKLGLDYDSLRERYPRLICAQVTGYGDLGPQKDAPGFDSASFWAASGFLADMTVKGPNSYPVNAPTGMGDITAGIQLAAGILAALYARQQTGLGDRVTTSLYGSAIWAMSPMILAAQDRYGFPYPKVRYEPGSISYRTSDDEWLTYTILEHERYFPALCKVLGVPEMAEDPRFKSQEACSRLENKSAQVHIFEEIFATRTAAEWVADLAKVDIVASRLSHFNEIPREAQALENHYVTEHQMPNGSACMIPRIPLSAAGMEQQPSRCAPLLGAHTREVFEELGIR